MNNIKIFIVISFILVFVPIIFLLILNYHNHKAILSQKTKKIKDGRYYELNNKIQLLYVVSSIFILIISFLGYTTKEKMDNEIQKEVSNKVSEKVSEITDSIKKIYVTTLDTMMILANNRFEIMDNIIKDQRKEKLSFSKKLQNEDGFFRAYTTELITVFDISEMDMNKGIKDEPAIMYFKNIKQSSGKILPIFNKPPFLIPTVKGIGDIKIIEVNKDYFKFQVVRFVNTDSKARRPFAKIEGFNLVIIDTMN